MSARRAVIGARYCSPARISNRTGNRAKSNRGCLRVAVAGGLSARALSLRAAPLRMSSGANNGRSRSAANRAMTHEPQTKVAGPDAHAWLQPSKQPRPMGYADGLARLASFSGYFCRHADSASLSKST